jgi:hypothetical protein
MKKYSEKLLMWTWFMLVGITAAEAVESNSLDLFVDPAKSHLWRTATTNTPNIQWETPEGAVSATLSVESRYGAKSYDVTGEIAFELKLETPESPDTENVYDLTLTFDCGASNVVRRGQIGVVRGLGAFGAAGASADIRKGDAGWSKLRGNSAVLQLPAGSKTLAIDGEIVETGLDGAAGWYRWQGITSKSGRAPYELSLLTEKGELTADVIVLANGFSLILR